MTIEGTCGNTIDVEYGTGYVREGSVSVTCHDYGIAEHVGVVLDAASLDLLISSLIAARDSLEA